MNSDLSQDYFTLFGLPISYDVDLGRLASVYRELQRSVHPDRFVTSSDRERLLSVQRATQVNEAFNCLKSPLQRARHLLHLHNIEFDDEKETNKDAEFLLEQLELRETLADIAGSSEPLILLDKMMLDIRQRINTLQLSLSSLLSVLSHENLMAAKLLIQKMQFLLKLQHEAEELEEDLVNAL